MDTNDLVDAYSRVQALKDGELVDCSELASEAGFRYPVALSRAAWALCVALSPAAKEAGNDEKGRLWDVLWMLSNAIRAKRAVMDPYGEGRTRVGFELACVTESIEPTLVELYAAVGPGDDGRPVVTVMLPSED